MTTTEPTRPPQAGPDSPADVHRPWRPAALGDLPEESIGELSYVVVDEMLGTLAALDVTSWPWADGLGRLRFGGQADRGHVVVHREELHGVLYDGWLQREPRVGDAFAARVTPDVVDRLAAGEDVPLGPQLRLADVLRGDVHDLSAEARTVAKLAYYSAMAPVVSFDEAVRRDQLCKIARTRTVGPRRCRAREWKGAVISATEPVPAEPPGALPANRLKPAPAGEFLKEITEEPESLVYFLLNVGDGDTQLVLLPAEEANGGRRRAVVVDVATTGKLVQLVDALADQGLLVDPHASAGVFPVVVATHPHDDHIGGMAEFLDRFGRAGQISDFWEPGYYHPSGAFVEMMTRLEECGIPRTEPTSGMTRWTGDLKITVLAPATALRVRYDSYGVDVNDASIALKLEFPAARVAQQLDDMRVAGNRSHLRLDSPWSLVLGADAQTTSWAHVAADFPQLQRQVDTALYRELAAARGRDHLAAQVFKVSHHASKHGINLELVERIHPDVALVSSVCGGGKYNFPHLLATEAIREAMQRSTSKRTERRKDYELGIHYTGAAVPGNGTARPAGTIAIVLSPKRNTKMRMWRFGDTPRQPVDLDAAARLTPVRSPR